MRVRQRDVALAAGVSQASVSLVVSGRAAAGGVSASTQDRIRKVMAELGYVVNPAARSLSGGRNGLIGVFTYDPVFPSRPNDYFHEFLIGIEIAAANAGQDLVLFSSTQQDNGDRRIYTRGTNRLRIADGTIVIGLHRDDGELRQLADEEYPFVSLGSYDTVSEAAWVAVDYAQAVGAIVEDLHQAGHRAIAYIEGEFDSLPFQARRAAFREATRGDMISVTRAAEVDAEVDDEVVGRWERDGVTAVVAENAQSTEIVASALDRLGVRVSADMSAVSLDIPIRDGATTTWSHLVMPKREVGMRAVALLSGILDGTHLRDHHETIACPPHHLETITTPRA